MVSSSFTVKFSAKVARVLECSDAHGTVEFTVDSGSDGDKSVCLEHHSAGSPRGQRYDVAFRSAKEYLESCGYKVEIYGKA